MTEDDWDIVHERYAKISEAVDKLLLEHCQGLTPEQDDHLRVKLTEDVRFW